MKKNNKVNKIIVLTIIGLILIVSLVIFILNYTKDSSSLSILEKNWISNHNNNVIDVSVYNDVPIYGQNGEGIIFSYLEEFTNSYGIEFNKVSYLIDNNKDLKNVAFKILDYSEELTDDDILLYEDYYVILTKNNQSINDYSDLSFARVAVLDSDINNVRYYLGNIKDMKIISTKDIKEMLDLYEQEEVDYLILPQVMYLDDILENDFDVVYHMSDIYKKYVINVSNDKTLKSIMKKYFMIYQKNFENTKYKTYFLNTFFKYKNITEAERMNYNATNYVYGYVTNMPYENTINKEFVGTISNYLSDFEEIANVDFKIVGYKNIAELKQAFSRGEVDLLLANFNTAGVNVDTLSTSSPFKEEYVIISKNNLLVDTIRSLKGINVYTVAGTYLYDHLVSNGVNAKGYDNTDTLLRNIGNDSVVMLNMDTYEYYKDKKFKDYKIVYQGTIDENYTFVVRDVNKNKTFYELFDYYVSSVNYKNIRYEYHTNYITNSKNELSVMMKYVLVIIAIIFSLVALIFGIITHKKNKTELNKEDKLKFIDVMTSLKNRNYLNYNIKSWDEFVVYPQAIVIIDLNNIKYINDNYGHSEGDEVIKKAASILIANQEENTDIIRTDGNEFLIYMVGYEEKKVIEYTRRISKALKDLPHNFGATLGYSMILDDVKTIDDAINEATLAMRQAKEKL